MAQKHYSPQLDRFLVCALWHEGQRQKKPMTEVANELLTKGLQDSDSWKAAEMAMALQKTPSAHPTDRRGHAA